MSVDIKNESNRHVTSSSDGFFFLIVIYILNTECKETKRRIRYVNFNNSSSNELTIVHCGTPRHIKNDQQERVETSPQDKPCFPPVSYTTISTLIYVSVSLYFYHFCCITSLGTF